MTQIATLGGGCFWCIEAAFENLQGVHKVVSGYSGGHVRNPTYREVCGKKTGHAEVVQVHFDSEEITYADLLEVFWTVHDPTTKDRQGNDVGPQYRSVIFYHNERQRAEALDSIKTFANLLYEDQIVTELLPFEEFYKAEPEHQDFYRLNPNYGYCRVVIDPKIVKVRNKFAHRLKTS